MGRSTVCVTHKIGRMLNKRSLYLSSGLVGESELFPRPQRMEEAFWRVTLHNGDGEVDMVDDDVNSRLYQQYRRQVKTYFESFVATRGPDATIEPNGYDNLEILAEKRLHHMSHDRG